MEYSIPLLQGRSLPGHCYCLLLAYAKKILVNTGVAPAGKDLNALLSEAGIICSTLDCVLNTDSHPCHIGNNFSLQEKNRNLTFYAHPEAIPAIEDIAVQTRHNYRIGHLKLVSGDIRGALGLQDRQKLLLGGETAMVLYTPGRSADAISLFLEKNKMLVTGGALIEKGQKPDYTDLAGLKHTLRQLTEFQCDYYFSSYSGLIKKTDRDLVKEALSVLDKIDKAVKEKYRQTRDVDAIAGHVLSRCRIAGSVDHGLRQAVSQHIAAMEG